MEKKSLDLRSAVVAFCLLILFVSAAFSRDLASRDAFAQQAELTSSDPAHLDFLGASVAISSDGNTVVVGMGSTHVAGAVSVFVKPASGWGNMTQVATLTASDGAVNDYLGYSVAISGNTIIAGAPNAHNHKGAAYIFVKPASGWTDMTETAELTGSDRYGTMGNSVAISGNTVVVGTPDVSLSVAGAVYLFVKPASGWASMTQTAKLTPSDGAEYDAFGSGVAISGNTVIAEGKGKVYLYLEPPGGWTNATQNAWLTVPNGYVGSSVAINGDTVVAGGPYASVGSKSEQGAAYVFLKPASGWQNMNQTATLTASDGKASDEFGYAVSISGNWIVTGSPYAAINSVRSRGAGYTYVKPATGWKSTSHFNSKLTAADGAQGDTLGWSVSLGGATVAAGAPGVSSQQGAAYIFGQ